MPKSKTIEQSVCEYYTIARNTGSWLWVEHREEYRYGTPEPAAELAKNRTSEIPDETERANHPYFVIRRTERVKIERV